MTMSLAAEPRRKGLYEPHFWTKSSNTPQAHTSANLVPLFFPEHLPYVTFINRSQLFRGRLGNGGPTQLNVDDVQTIRSGEVNLGSRRRSFGAPDAVPGRNIGGTVIPLFDGGLILLVSPGKEVTSSRPSSRILSRLPSCVGEPSLGTMEKKCHVPHLSPLRLVRRMGWTEKQALLVETRFLRFLRGLAW